MSLPEGAKPNVEADVVRLVDEIRADVERRKLEGQYPPDLVLETAVFDGPLGRALDDARREGSFAFDPPVRSTRRWLGMPATVIKGLIRRALRWHTHWLLGQLQAYTDSESRLDRTLSVQLDAQEAALRRLQRQLERARLEGPPAPGNQAPEQNGVGSAQTWTRQFQQAIDYAAFEDQFRQPEDVIAKRQIGYLELFRGTPGPVVDVGCGRGEFVRLLADAGIDSYGIDMDPSMVERCRQHGLDVRQGDVVSHLSGVEAGSLGGIFCCQVIEHLEPKAIVGLFDAAVEALAPGGVLVIETINPQSVSVFTGALYVDLGHLRPVHPFTLQFLAEHAGMRGVEVRYLSHVPDDHRLSLLQETGDPGLDSLVAQMNDNLRKVDGLLYGPLDFALVARR